MTKRVQANVSGHVQGVGFRYYAAHVAGGLGIVGTVRNTHDGGIESIVEGEEDALHAFIVALRHGPQRAEVTEVATAWSEPTGEFDTFDAIA